MKKAQNKNEQKQAIINNIDIEKLTKSEITDYIKNLNKKLNALEDQNNKLKFKNKELSILNNENLFKSLVDNIPSILYRSAHDKDWTLDYINGESERISGYPASDFFNNKVRSFASIIHKDDLQLTYDIVQKSINNKQPFTIEYRIIHKDGSIKWVYEKGQGIYNSEGDLLYLDGVISDITEKKKTEDIITTNLKQKEILLKEIHHRVKNNLQIISSIINLQKSKLSDANAIKIFEESQERIHAMSLIHQKLYLGNNYEAVNFKEYLNDLINFQKNLSPTTQCNLKCIELSLGLETAVPLGLISSELITNSFKHAYTNKADNRLDIILSEKQKGKYMLHIIDNGIGLPKKFNIKDTDTLGLQIVSSLSEQIDASVKYSSDKKGTEFIIEFSVV